MTPIETYEQFCNALVSPCTLPLGRRDQTRFHITHMLMGLGGEIVEAYISEDADNLKNELGDMLFYRTNLVSFLLLDPKFLSVTHSILQYEETLNDEDTWTVLQIADKFLDLGKREFFYGQVIGYAEILLLLARFDQWFHFQMQEAGVSEEELREINMKKLRKRYEKGKFSVEESLTKRDGT